MDGSGSDGRGVRGRWDVPVWMGLAALLCAAACWPLLWAWAGHRSPPGGSEFPLGLPLAWLSLALAVAASAGAFRLGRGRAAPAACAVLALVVAAMWLAYVVRYRR
jgi:hypothetical protein